MLCTLASATARGVVGRWSRSTAIGDFLSRSPTLTRGAGARCAARRGRRTFLSRDGPWSGSAFWSDGHRLLDREQKKGDPHGSPSSEGLVSIHRGLAVAPPDEGGRDVAP